MGFVFTSKLSVMEGLFLLFLLVTVLYIIGKSIKAPNDEE